MDLHEAERLIAPAVRPGGSWSDLGAGSGTFTLALARLLGAAGTVYAVERDASAVVSLATLARSGARNDRAEIVVVEADFTERLELPALDGALLGNALHFVPTARQATVLTHVASGTKEDGVVVVVEYENRPASQWVPYPVSSRRLAEVARIAGLGEVKMIGRVRSIFGGNMYAARLQR
jgi:SAM-dependent methyltransferase